ncbi:Acetyltransferase, GNAT family [Loktanella atrilutea]|uniref:Acetyltransferase, GNAT family n=1 Tax=Loktanella atrilutea TaxID=366533 RepID=A0A1M5ARD8_LOKAT|nr:GNAT family N-acetyltransferase [Loktanella atrilutea]SHF32821.1 Acetyltransferase, GNAT family [Loktanella atrilutea]
MTPCIRPYDVADAGALASIFYRAVRIGAAGHYTPVQLADWAPEVRSAEAYADRLAGLDTWVARVDGVPAGFLSLSDGHHIDLLFVDPAQIGRGLAFALYRHLLAELTGRPVARLTVEASAQSRTFFRRQGWNETGQRTRGTGAAAIVTTLMAYDLPPPGG